MSFLKNCCILLKKLEILFYRTVLLRTASGAIEPLLKAAGAQVSSLFTKSQCWELCHINESKCESFDHKS